MKLLVCIKHVPDTTTVVKLSEDGRGLDPSGVKWVISPYDEFALEQAIRLREDGPAEEIAVLCLGPPDAQVTLRQALAIGADRAVLIESEELAGRDASVRSRVIAAAIGAENPDLVLTGKLGVGTDEGETASRLSVLLDRPHAGQVTTFEISDGGFRAWRGIEGGTEIVEGALPAILSCDKGPRQPRYPSLKGIMQAKKKPLDVRTPADLGIDPSAPEWASKIEVLSLDLPPARSGCRLFDGTAEASARSLVQALRDEAKVI